MVCLVTTKRTLLDVQDLVPHRANSSHWRPGMRNPLNTKSVAIASLYPRHLRTRLHQHRLTPAAK